MDSCFDPTIPTEISTPRNIRILLALIFFWFLGAIYPLIFRPRSYAHLSKLEHVKFPESEKFKFDRHLYSNEVYAYLENFTNFYNHKAKMFTLRPQTFEGRKIKLVRLQLPIYNDKKKKGEILVVGGVAANIWDSVSATIDLIYKLCEDCKYKVPYLLEYDWYIIPVLNPDGYDYTLSIRDKELVRANTPKNRVYYKSPENAHNCRGVYIDRNFGFHWGESKAKDYSDYCWMQFAGLYPFSENEVKAFIGFITSQSHEKRDTPFTMYVQVHGSNDRDEVTYPWRFTTLETYNQHILNYDYLQLVKVSFALAASGVLSDWLMGIMHIPYIFTIEPTYQVTNSTDVPDQQLYMEKVITVIFGLVKQLRLLNSSANVLTVKPPHFLVLFSFSQFF